MPSLSDLNIVDYYARQFLNISDTLPTVVRCSRIEKLLIECARMAQIPMPKIRWKSSLINNGDFSAIEWDIRLRNTVIDSPQTPYHELRHAEQTMRELRALLNGQIGMPDQFRRFVQSPVDKVSILHKAMRIPRRIILQAQALGRIDDSLVRLADDCLNSHYGHLKNEECVMARIDEIEAVKSKAKAARKSGTANDLAHYQAVRAIAARRYASYKHLPKEKDAFAMGDLVLEHIASLM